MSIAYPIGIVAGNVNAKFSTPECTNVAPDHAYFAVINPWDARVFEGPKISVMLTPSVLTIGQRHRRTISWPAEVRRGGEHRRRFILDERRREIAVHRPDDAALDRLEPWQRGRDQEFVQDVGGLEVGRQTQADPVGVEAGTVLVRGRDRCGVCPRPATQPSRTPLLSRKPRTNGSPFLKAPSGTSCPSAALVEILRFRVVPTRPERARCRPRSGCRRRAVRRLPQVLAGGVVLVDPPYAEDEQRVLRRVTSRSSSRRRRARPSSRIEPVAGPADLAHRSGAYAVGGRVRLLPETSFHCETRSPAAFRVPDKVE